MNQAVLITAYQDLEHLKAIVNFFDEDFTFYIHLDEKSSISNFAIKELGEWATIGYVGKKYNVNWGGYNHLKAILFLARMALKDEDNFFFHLISGSDFPIKSPEKFKNFFLTNEQKVFLNYFEVPFSGWANNGGMDRLEYYNFFDLWNYKIPKEKYRINRILNLQKKLGFKRTIPKKFPKLYGGSTWWSMNRDCLGYVINFTDTRKHIFKRFKYTFCSEEFYFQTVILNSEFSSKVETNSLRHVDWVPRNGNNPAILDESDLDILIGSEAFFARKFQMPHSRKLLVELKKRL